MNEFGNRLAKKRKEAGFTQTEFAEKLCVTRQTVGRWETGSVLPDIEKIPDIAELLGVSCDYLLRDDVTEEKGTAVRRSPGRLIGEAAGKKVRLRFFDGEADIDLYDAVCVITDFEGSWMKVEAETKKGRIEKMIPLASVLSVELLGEDA